MILVLSKMKFLYQISKSSEHSDGFFLEVHVSYTVEVIRITRIVVFPLSTITTFYVEVLCFRVFRITANI